MNLSQLTDILPTPDDSAWYDVIIKFKNYTTKFTENYNRLKTINIDPSRYPALADEQLELLKRGTTVKANINKITNTIDDAWTWLKSKFGFDGLNDVATLSHGLGFVPLIPIAVVAGSVTLLVKWILDYSEFVKRYDYATELEQKGYSTTQINELMTGITQEKPLIDFGKAMPVLIIAGLGIFVIMNKDKF